MPVRTEIEEGLVPVKVYTTELEAAARLQLVNISRLPIVHHHVAAMPDVHLGHGGTVGPVIPTKKEIIPAAGAREAGGERARSAGAGRPATVSQMRMLLSCEAVATVLPSARRPRMVARRR